MAVESSLSGAVRRSVILQVAAFRSGKVSLGIAKTAVESDFPLFPRSSTLIRDKAIFQAQSIPQDCSTKLASRFGPEKGFQNLFDTGPACQTKSQKHAS